MSVNPYFTETAPDYRRWMVINYRGHEGQHFWLYRRNPHRRGRMERIGCYQTIAAVRAAARRFWQQRRI